MRTALKQFPGYGAKRVANRLEVLDDGRRVYLVARVAVINGREECVVATVAALDIEPRQYVALRLRETRYQMAREIEKQKSGGKLPA